MDHGKKRETMIIQIGDGNKSLPVELRTVTQGISKAHYSENWSLPGRGCDEIKSLPESMSLSQQQKEENRTKTTPALHLIGREGAEISFPFFCNKSVSFLCFSASSDRLLPRWSHKHRLLLNCHRARGWGASSSIPGDLRTRATRGVR